MKAACQKCKKRKSCKIPCYPVEQMIKGDSPAVFERRRRDGITVYPGSTRTVHRSSLSSGEDTAGNPRLSSEEAQAFSTENENPFRHYEPNHKQTSIFLKRFFGKWSYKDIAQAHDISVDAAPKLYYAAVQRLLSVILEMDAVDKMTREEKKRADVAKQKRYVEKNRDKVNSRRRAHYQKNKDQINAKRRELYAAKKSTQIDTH